VKKKKNELKKEKVSVLKTSTEGGGKII